MSILITDKIIDTASGATLLRNTGSVIQVVRKRYDTITTVASSGATVRIPASTISITPKYSDSRLIIKWVIQGEPSQHDMVFKIMNGTSVITTSGEQGYNNVVGNQVYSGYFCGLYDQNDSSTPNPHSILYTCLSGSTSARTYGIGFNGSDGGARTFYVNRGVSASSQAAYENSVTVATIMEVVQ
jgi:hypothetical protein